MKNKVVVAILLVLAVVSVKIIAVYNANEYYKIGLDSFRHKVMVENYIQKNKIDLSLSKQDEYLQYYTPMFYFVISRMVKTGISVENMMYIYSFISFILYLILIYFICKQFTGRYLSLICVLMAAILISIPQPAPRVIVIYVIIPYLIYSVMNVINSKYSFIKMLMIFVPPIAIAVLTQPHPINYFILCLFIYYLLYSLCGKDIDILNNIRNIWISVSIGYVIGFYLYRLYLATDLYSAIAFMSGYIIAGISRLIYGIPTEWEGLVYILFFQQIVFVCIIMNYIFNKRDKISKYNLNDMVLGLLALTCKLTYILCAVMLLVGIVLYSFYMLISFNPPIEYFEKIIGEEFVLNNLLLNNGLLNNMAKPSFIALTFIIALSFNYLVKHLKYIISNPKILLLISFLMPIIIIIPLCFVSSQYIIIIRFIMYYSMIGVIFVIAYYKITVKENNLKQNVIFNILLAILLFINITHGGIGYGIDNPKSDGYQWILSHMGYKTEAEIENLVNCWYLPKIKSEHKINIINYNIGKISLNKKNIALKNAITEIYNPDIELKIFSNIYNIKLPMFYKKNIPKYTSDKVYSNDQIEFYTRSE